MEMDQRKLNPELFQWRDERQKKLNVVKTTTTPNGQVIDWVPVESQDAGGQIASPPPFEPLSAHPMDAQRPVGAVQFELDDPAAERGPAGTVPILRPDFSGLTRTVRNFEHLTKRGGLLVNKHRPNKQVTDPNPFGYFHCTDSQNGRIYGCDGYFNVWDPAINTPPGPGDDHSIIQVWLQNYDKPQLQSVEGGYTIDRALNGDLAPHVFTYYTVNGYTQDGDNLGGYNRLHKGWVQYSTSVFPGIRINGASTMGGAQLEIAMKFQLWQGNWWISVQNVWMGYYPGSLFNGGLGNYAEWLGFGGEVYSSLANPTATLDQMGSGRRAADGWTYAAYLRNLRNQTDANGTMVNNNGVPVTDTANGGVDPYTIQMHMESGSTWGSYFWVGGPAA